MAADPRPPTESTGPASGSIATEPLADRPADAPTGRDPPVRRSRTSLERRIELARLRARTAALERALADQRRRRQAVVDHYERLLEERDDPDRRDDRDRRADRPTASPLARLRRGLRGLVPSLGIASPAPSRRG